MELAAAATSGLDAATAAAVMALLGRLGTQAAREALGVLAESQDVNVRIEAKMLAAPPEQAHVELTSMLDSGSALVRMAALRALARHGLKQTFPVVARSVKAPTFHDLGNDERRELLRTMLTLSSEHGEPIALDIVKKGGVFASSSREESRAAAAEILGELSASPEVEEALREVAQSRWGTSDETRHAANDAAKAIRARAFAGAPGGASVPPSSGDKEGPAS
jgi:hypothetical protein